MGTLAQLKNLLNRSSVPCSPKKDVHATEDFLQVVLEGHVLSAALEHFGQESLSVCPDPSLSESLKKMPPKLRTAEFEDLASKIIEPHLDFSLLSGTSGSTPTASSDGVRAYAQSLLSHLLLWAEFEDSIREGDGPRVLRCFKFLLILFKDAR